MGDQGSASKAPECNAEGTNGNAEAHDTVEDEPPAERPPLACLEDVCPTPSACLELGERCLRDIDTPGRLFDDLPKFHQGGD